MLFKNIKNILKFEENNNSQNNEEFKEKSLEKINFTKENDNREEFFYKNNYNKNKNCKQMYEKIEK